MTYVKEAEFQVSNVGSKKLLPLQPAVSQTELVKTIRLEMAREREQIARLIDEKNMQFLNGATQTRRKIIEQYKGPPAYGSERSVQNNTRLKGELVVNK